MKKTAGDLISGTASNQSVVTVVRLQHLISLVSDVWNF